MKRRLDSFSENLLGDLRNPRILAALVLLVLAIAAVAVLLPSTGTADQSAVVGGVPAASGSRAGSEPTPVALKAPAVGRPVPYGTADPFRTPPVKKAKTTTTASQTTTPAPSTTSTSTSIVSGNGNTISTATTTATTPVAPTTTQVTPPPPLYTISKGITAGLRFGISGHALGYYQHVHGRSTFPSSTNAAVMFVGVDADADRAVFLPSKGSVASGMGKCLPSLTNCEYFELKKGQREHVLAQQPGGGSTLYAIKYLGPGKATKKSTTSN